MTQPIRVYPTETPGLYRTEDGRLATRYRTQLGFLDWCVHCTQVLGTGIGLHWRIGDALHCRKCVQVVGETEVP